MIESENTISFPVYHMVPDNMQGTILYPLNVLKKKYSGIYTDKTAKYQGREPVRERTIPFLNCLWNDVLFLCPVHPAKILKKLREIGYDYPRERFYKIDAGLLAHNNTVVLTYPGNGIEPQYHKQSPNSISGIDELPQITIEYFQECFNEKKRFMLFAYIPHVMYKGNIDISKVPIMEV